MTNIPEIMKMVNIFIMPSLREGLGIAALEAMAAEIPIVATKVGGLPEVIEDGISGILVPPRNDKAIVKALVYLIKNSEKAQEMGKQGLKICREKFSLKLMINNIEELYKSCLM